MARRVTIDPTSAFTDTPSDISQKLGPSPQSGPGFFDLSDMPLGIKIAMLAALTAGTAGAINPGDVGALDAGASAADTGAAAGADVAAAPAIGGTLDEAAALGDGSVGDLAGQTLDATQGLDTSGLPAAVPQTGDAALDSGYGQIDGSGIGDVTGPNSGLSMLTGGNKLSLQDLLKLEAVKTGGSILSTALAPKPQIRTAYTGPQTNPETSLDSVITALKGLQPNLMAGNTPSGQPGVQVGGPTRMPVTMLPGMNAPGLPGAGGPGPGGNTALPAGMSQIQGATSLIKQAAQAGMAKSVGAGGGP